MSRLTHPVLDVQIDDGGEIHTVHANNGDMVAWDLERSRRKWPTVEEAPFLWLTFLAWHALRRTSRLPDAVGKLETFLADVHSVSSPSIDDEPVVHADPSPPAVEAG